MPKEITYYMDGSVSNFSLGMFATGSYMQKCRHCDCDFFGDKLAFICLGCSIKGMEENAEANRKLIADMKKRYEPVDVKVKINGDELDSTIQ